VRIAHSYEYICIRVVNFADGKVSTDDIRQTLGASWWVTLMSVIDLVC